MTFNKTFATAGLLAASICSAPAAFAGEESGPYLGLTFGTDQTGVAGLDDGSAKGVVLGWRVQKLLAIEGVIANTSHDMLVPGCTAENDTIGIYGALRTEGQFYVKGRLGLLSEDIASSGTCAGVAAASDTGMSLGAGVGARFGKGALEVEYTIIEQDINRLGASLLFNF